MQRVNVSFSLTNLVLISPLQLFWMKKRIVFVVCSLFLTLLTKVTLAQEVVTDTTSIQTESAVDTSAKDQKKGLFKKLGDYFREARKDKTSSKKFDVSFIGGPHYSVNNKFGIGLLAAGLYRMDRNDLSIQPSNVALFSDFSTTGFFKIGIDGLNIFPHDAYRIDYRVSFDYNPTRYYGIGYQAGLADDYSEYKEFNVIFRANVLKKLMNHFYGGLSFVGTIKNSRSFEKDEFIPDQPLKNTIIGPGVMVSYDKRDFEPNPERGVYISYRQNFYTKTLGSTTNYNEIEANFRAYKKIAKGSILAFDAYGDFNNGDVPWSMLALMGDSHRMRGYYKGRYRDKKILTSQVEFRQHIKGRSGVVAWVGAGSVFDNFNALEWGQILPNYGVGYRWEFKHRVNARVDFGFGKKLNGINFTMQEAF